MKRISSVIAVLLTSGVFFSAAVLTYAAPMGNMTVVNRSNLGALIDTSVATMLKRDVDWLAAAGKCASGMDAHLEFTGSYTQQKNSLVGYVRGTLFLKDGMLSGEGKQYFNDRIWEKQSPPPASSDGGVTFNIPQNNPFNPDATDRLGLTIDPATGKAKIILLSWGGGTAEIQLEYKNGVFYGFLSSGGMHAFVFKRVNKSCIY